MKNLRSLKLLLLLLLTTAVIAHAQTPTETPSMAEIQKQLKAARAIINKAITPKQRAEMQKQMNYAKQKIRFQGVQNAQGKDITDSVIQSIKMPDPVGTVGKISSDLSADMAKLKGLQNANKQALNTGLPQPGTAAFSAVPDAQRAQILAYAQAMVTAAIPKMNLLNPMLKQSVDDVLKDSTITAQAQGMEIFAAGAPLPVVQYMVAKGVLKQPSNPWAANALGVVMRADNRYKEAIQCFKYAYWINPCMLIKCNMAWAIAYYGDFITAKRYFHEVLNIVPHYNSAWEGLGMIAYQQGDTATLFQCLAAQLNVTAMGGPDDGPSDSFVSFCGGVKMDQDMANAGKVQNSSTTPPSPDSNESGDEGNQDPPPTADSEYPTFPSMGGIFAQNIDGLMEALKGTASYRQSILDAKKKSEDKAKQAFSSLSKMDERPYTDDQGMKVTPFRYSKFVTEFHGVQAEFSGRVGYVMGQYYTQQQKLINGIAAESIEFTRNFIAAMKAAGPDSYDEILCEWKKKARSMIGSQFSGATISFVTAFAQLKDQINWYIDASSNSIRRMHKPDWNHYLNATRRDDINQAVLNMYDYWVVIQAAVCQPAPLQLMVSETKCFTQLRTIGGEGGQGPKPTETTFKKFDSPPMPCDKMFNMDKSYKYANVHRDCDGTRVAVYPIVEHVGGSLDAGPLHGSAEATAKLGVVLQTTTKTGETRVGTTGNLSAEISLGVGVKDGEQTTRSNASAGAGVSAKAEFNYDSTIVIGNDGSIAGRAKTASFDASMEAHADASISNPMGAVSANTEWKASAKGMIDVSTVAGSSNTYNVNQSSFSASQSSSTSTHLPGQDK